MDSKSIGLCPQGFESPRCRSLLRSGQGFVKGLGLRFSLSLSLSLSFSLSPARACVVSLVFADAWPPLRAAASVSSGGAPGSDVTHPFVLAGRVPCHEVSSQRSLHNAPIFRLLVKVTVNGTHQCDYANFCGNLGSQRLGATCMSSAASNRPCQWI